MSANLNSNAKRILVADDSLTIQKVIRLALSNEGYEIHTVSDGNDAVQQISTLRPDVVLIDVSLPHQSAFAVKQTVNTHEDLKFVKFVLMSSAFESVNETLAEQVAFDARLTKPFDPAHLREVLQKVLSLRPHTRPNISPPPLEPQAPPPPPSPAPPSAPTFSPPPILPPSPPSLPPLANSAAPGLPPMPPPISFNEPSGVDLSVEEDDLSKPLKPVPNLDLNSPDQDIKHLTESTFNLSEGLQGGGTPLPPPSIPSSASEFDWNIDEPVLKPGTNLFDQTAPSFTDFSKPTEEPTIQLQVQKTQSPPAPPIFSPSAGSGERTGELLPNLAPTPTFAAGPAVSPEQLEKWVRDEVQLSLRKMSQESIPSLAEKIIKEEIHRILTQLAEGR